MKRYLCQWLAICLTAAVAGACSRGPRVYVPLQSSAKEQYEYAVNFQQKNSLVLHDQENPERRMQTRETVRQVFEKVVEYFPEDRHQTPLAKLELADMKAGLDLDDVRVSKGDLKEAIRMFRELRAEYPEYEYIQVKTLFDEARCHLRPQLKNYGQAQALFKRVVDEFQTSKNPVIRDIVALSRAFYQKTYTEE